MWRQRAAAAHNRSVTAARACRADSGASPKLVGAALGLFAVFGALGAALMSHADVRFVDRVVAAIDGPP